MHKTRRLEKIVLNLADPTYLSAVATEMHIIAAWTLGGASLPATRMAAWTVVLHVQSEYCYCEMPANNLFTHTASSFTMQWNTEIKLFSIFSEKEVYFSVHSPESIQTGKGCISQYIPRLALIRIQYKMYIVQSIVCLTSHHYATKHLCRLLSALHICAILLTRHPSEVFPCSLQPSPHEAGGAVGAVASCPSSLLPLAIFLEWWQQPSLPWPWQPWLYHGGLRCVLASCLSCMVSLSFSSNNGLGE